jgi:hypothetical protein
MKVKVKESYVSRVSIVLTEALLRTSSTNEIYFLSISLYTNFDFRK